MSNSEILREFLLETHENLALLDSDLITLENNPTEKDTLAQVFRTLHSVKGTAGFLGLVELQAVAHSAESLLSKLRSGELRFNPTIATAMLRVVDAIREMLSNIEALGVEGDADYSVLIAEVDQLRLGGQGVANPSATVLVEQPVAPTSILSPTTLHPEEPMPPISGLSSVTTYFEPQVATSSESKSSQVVDSNIRVDVGLLDKLLTLVGELVIARNQIVQYSTSYEDDGFLSAVQRLNLLTTELQTSVMFTRMQPIGNVLNKFPRVVRDLALACGKKVRFEMEGQETELDKTLIEAIRDPLTHMVRNSIDHGIETPEVRKSLGKSEEGRLRMAACHEGGKVVIEISDDGVGIDVVRVRDKAVSASLVSADMAARMSRQELLRLVFLPGFSTADRVTQFSGRGVGMDVVRTNIEKIGGTVDIESVQGQGTTIRTKIPLTLAIIPALIIDSCGQRYAIPQVSLLELVRPDPGQAMLGIEWIHEIPVYRLRGALLPLVFLNEQLNLASGGATADDWIIIVLQADACPFGLVVNAIRDTEEIVVKPLQKQLKGISVFSGAAIMGDGRVALVLDVLGLAQRANVISGARRQALGNHERTAEPTPSSGQTLLLFAPNVGEQMAIPLSLVARLEVFPRSALETVGARQMVQYRGEILPLIDVSQELEQLRLGRLPGDARRHDPIICDESSNTVSVVVYAANHQYVGLKVDKILDIVHDQVAQRSGAHRPCVLFTAIVQGKVTEFLDVAALVREATSEFLQPTT